MRTSICCVAIMVTVLYTSCRDNKPAESASGEIEWAQLDDFHFLMAESFHPYADSGNLVPARQHAEEMARLAKAWSKGELPAKVNNNEVKALLKRLGEETADFTTVVSTGNDARIGESLKAVHDLFHEIQEHWYAADDDHSRH